MASPLRSSLALLILLAAACSSSSNDTPRSASVVDGGPTPGPGPVLGEDAGPGSETGPTAPIVTLGPPDYVELGVQQASFDLEIPTGTLGFTFDTGGVAVNKVTDAAGAVHLPADRPAGLADDYRRLTRFPSSSKMLAVPSGTWKIELAGPATVKVVRQRTNDGQFHGGTVDLYVYLPTGLHVGDFITGELPPDAVTPENAAANAVVTKFLDVFFTQLERVTGLDKGTVTYVAVDAKFVTIDSEAERNAAFQIAGPLRKGEKLGLHMLLTEFIEQKDVIGFAPRVGGVGFDRPATTVLVKLKDQKSAPEKPSTYTAIGYGAGDLSAGAALHETFHLWGIPHTSEEAVANYDDGFTDTVSCSPAQLTADPFKCPDGSNAVFPRNVSPISKSSLSPHQLTVVRGMPVYKPALP